MSLRGRVVTRNISPARYIPQITHYTPNIIMMARHNIWVAFNWFSMATAYDVPRKGKYNQFKVSSTVQRQLWSTFLQVKRKTEYSNVTREVQCLTKLRHQEGKLRTKHCWVGNHSVPAPSQSEAVIRGDWRYTKPSSWKNLCVAKARAERTLDTADIVFVRARRCAIVRKNSDRSKSK